MKKLIFDHCSGIYSLKEHLGKKKYFNSRNSRLISFLFGRSIPSVPLVVRYK